MYVCKVNAKKYQSFDHVMQALHREWAKILILKFYIIRNNFSFTQLNRTELKKIYMEKLVCFTLFNFDSTAQILAQ